MTSTALYRFWAADDTLLYVGITLDIGRRFTQHADDKPWWCTVSRITVEQHPTRDLALMRERDAIKTEMPLWNVKHNGHRIIATADPAPIYVPLFRDGQVLAIGHADGTCPVGVVTEVCDQEFNLALLHWGTGGFGDAGERWIRDADVRAFRAAQLMTRGQRRTGGYRDTDSVFDCDPLAAFQTTWCSTRRTGDDTPP